MNQEAVKKALQRIERLIVAVKENIGEGYKVEQCEDLLSDLLVYKEALEKQLEKRPFMHKNGLIYCNSCKGAEFTVNDLGTENYYCGCCGQKLLEDE